MGSAMFRLADSGELLPQSAAASGWGAQHMRGMAISGAAARATGIAVSELGRADLRPVRWTIDLFRVATMMPTTATAVVVRAGRRLCLVDAQVSQADRVVARASTLYLTSSAPPAGQVWTPDTTFTPPPENLRHTPGLERLYRSDGGDWTPPGLARTDALRKDVWQYPIDIVDGESPTAFQMAASVADVANAATNFGSDGLEFVNADVTLTLARLPRELELGMRALTRTEQDGIAVAGAEVFDRYGRIGAASVSTMTNGTTVVDLREHGHAAVAT
ncbi:acyl-CoA thioesterase domain-containing protein [Nocardia nova]|uniref:acyl-CoA thioesterase domain-containing protein n=1 Tax=Nocardia nova TaxID=37330 RepID=UPI0033DDC809